jgi:hypothetical protein
MRLTAVVLLTVGVTAGGLIPGAADLDGVAQTRRRPARPRATAPPKPAPPPEPVTEPAAIQCPQVLGAGVRTMRTFCDVQAGVDPAAGILVMLPDHVGPVTLTFDLHNRHTYSEDLIKSNRAYRRYVATIGVLTSDNTLLSRFVVSSEFRTAADLVDRVAGGSGPGGLKAVAPVGTESITVVVPAEERAVSILGDTLREVRPDGDDTFSAQGRPIAVVSDVKITYQPARAAAAPAARRR